MFFVRSVFRSCFVATDSAKTIINSSPHEIKHNHQLLTDKVPSHSWFRIILSSEPHPLLLHPHHHQRGVPALQHLRGDGDHPEVEAAGAALARALPHPDPVHRLARHLCRPSDADWMVQGDSGAGRHSYYSARVGTLDSYPQVLYKVTPSRLYPSVRGQLIMIRLLESCH